MNRQAVYMNTLTNGSICILPLQDALRYAVRFDIVGSRVKCGSAFRYLHDCAGCFCPERRASIAPSGKHCLSRRTPTFEAQPPKRPNGRIPRLLLNFAQPLFLPPREPLNVGEVSRRQFRSGFAYRRRSDYAALGHDVLAHRQADVGLLLITR